MGQVSVETAKLQSWAEIPHGNPTDYFIKKYWTSSGLWADPKTHRSTLGSSKVTANGITIRIPATARGSPSTKVYELDWADGPTLKNVLSKYATVTFTLSNGYYVYNYTGAIPPDGANRLLVVDPVNNSVKLALYNSLGNWSPQDAYTYYGRGPLMLTGRYNYQQAADTFDATFGIDLMNNPGVLADPNNASLGFQVAAWFWEPFLHHHLNEKINADAYETTRPFTSAITHVVQGNNGGLDARIVAYQLARSILLDNTQQQAQVQSRPAHPLLLRGRDDDSVLPPGLSWMRHWVLWTFSRSLPCGSTKVMQNARCIKVNVIYYRCSELMTLKRLKILLTLLGAAAPTALLSLHRL